MIREINFDGIVGPSHNYAGLSPGNLAATANAGQVAHPRAAALQGVAKMRANLALGLLQGVLIPPPRPDHGWLARLAMDYESAPAHLKAQALSASSMWAANAATVSPAPDTADGRCHLTVANLVTMPHRSHEWPATLAQLQVAFADAARFVVRPPVLPPFGDEGAANHMRLCSAHDAPGVEVFVYGVSGGAFPARQHVEASRAVARHHGLDPARTLFVQQSVEAIAAGAFHNDVVAVANERILLAHEQAFADRDVFYADLRRLLPEIEIVEVPTAAVSLADAIGSYLFNAQLVTPPDGVPTLIVPEEARANPRVWRWIEAHLAGNGPVRRVEVVDVRESMANGGGPACLRLRVVCDPTTVDPRFLVDDRRLDRIAAVIDRHWPEAIAPDDLGDPLVLERIATARAALVEELELTELRA
ncbi:succinylarginine dihydrolase [Sphingomonas endophytica]|uniref:N-succinylarginine dihydrolase n=1 Tax=Sphingomonas endophytica TaxID=869719 RepID=A0A7X0JFX2_9SPHN|nr:N-succinylarginine dihydrolase [Sphingomonas endophytica]MBB6505826.1 succinylarginine dihydrolase [Sphingomonas endophytica]